MTTSHTHAKESRGKKHSGNGYSAGAGDLAGDIQSIKDGGISLAHHLKEDTFEIAKSAVTETKHRLGDAQSFAGAQLKRLEKEVIASPMRSVAFALAAGAVLSMILRRR